MTDPYDTCWSHSHAGIQSRSTLTPACTLQQAAFSAVGRFLTWILTGRGLHASLCASIYSYISVQPFHPASDVPPLRPPAQLRSPAQPSPFHPIPPWWLEVDERSLPHFSFFLLHCSAARVRWPLWALVDLGVAELKSLTVRVGHPKATEK